MKSVRRLLDLLLCLVLALNGVAIAHAGASTGHLHAAPADAAQDDVGAIDTAAHAMDADAASPCHEASGPDESHAAMPAMAMAHEADAPDASDAPCCDDAATCDHACMPAAAAALVPERVASATLRLHRGVPAVTPQPRAPPPAHPPVRPPIAL